MQNLTLVLLESPFAYRHDDPGQRRVGLLRNVTYARCAMHDCFLRGEAPYASHLLYTQPFVLDDNIPEERDLGIHAGLLWGGMAAKSVFYTDLGLSSGMKYGKENAEKALRPTEDRTLPGWGLAINESPRVTLLRLGLYDEATLDLIEAGSLNLFALAA
jgi:hypothetical protein